MEIISRLAQEFDVSTAITERVVALLDDSATVKRFYKEDGRFRLQPENSTMEPIYTDEVVILGKVVSLYRLVH